jgi:hypothetical protein
MAQAEVTKDATDGVGDAHVSSSDAVGSGRDLRLRQGIDVRREGHLLGHTINQPG